jgi:hypothetical protein
MPQWCGASNPRSAWPSRIISSNAFHLLGRRARFPAVYFHVGQSDRNSPLIQARHQQSLTVSRRDSCPPTAIYVDLTANDGSWPTRNYVAPGRGARQRARHPFTDACGSQVLEGSARSAATQARARRRPRFRSTIRHVARRRLLYGPQQFPTVGYASPCRFELDSGGIAENKGYYAYAAPEALAEEDAALAEPTAVAV